MFRSRSGVIVNQIVDFLCRCVENDVLYYNIVYVCVHNMCKKIMSWFMITLLWFQYDCDHCTLTNNGIMVKRTFTHITKWYGSLFTITIITFISFSSLLINLFLTSDRIMRNLIYLVTSSSSWKLYMYVKWYNYFKMIYERYAPKIYNINNY